MGMMAKKHNDKIEIEDLREAGEDAGDLMGYYCHGHVERWVFAELANKRSGAESSWDRRHVKPTECRHVWYRTVQMQDQPRGVTEFRPALPEERGSWPATVWDGIVADEYRRMRRILSDHEGGRCNGIAIGVNWCLRWLEVRDHGLHDEMLKAFRAKREELEDAKGAVS